MDYFKGCFKKIYITIKNRIQKTETASAMPKLSTFKKSERMQELIWLAESNFWICKTIYDTRFKSTTSHNQPDLLLLIANNSFNQAILILQSLLTTKNRGEIKIEGVLYEILANDPKKPENKHLEKLKDKMIESYPNHSDVIDKLKAQGVHGDELAEIGKAARNRAILKVRELGKQFGDAGFVNIRNQMIAHKDKRDSDPSGSIRRILNIEIINALENILKILVVESYFWFGYVPYNSELDTISHQLDEMLLAYNPDTNQASPLIL